jgi:hypothetical protein
VGVSSRVERSAARIRTWTTGTEIEISVSPRVWDGRWPALPLNLGVLSVVLVLGLLLSRGAVSRPLPFVAELPDLVTLITERAA